MSTDLETELTKEEQEQLRIKEQCKFVADGYRRCIEWLDNHHEFFILTQASIHPNKNTGAEINAGLLWHSDNEKDRIIKLLFHGMEAKKDVSNGGDDVRYTVVDEKLNITFKWSIYKPLQRTERYSETVTI